MQITIFRKCLRLVLLISLIAWVEPVHRASADIAPPPPPEGGNIQPNQEDTAVRMMAETVLVDIAATTGKQTPYAKVTASFTMRNLGDQIEQINVRFPLNLLYPNYQSDLNNCPYPEGGFPSINDFYAQVDGKPARISIIYERIQDQFKKELPKDVACWASFPVTFPIQQDVIINVSYSAEGYFGWSVDGLVEFPYVMVTGQGWADTIGSAEVVIRAPYELSQLNIMEYYPDQAQINGREIRWYFEDEEPESNISVTLVNPTLWNRIIEENKIVLDRPGDGEAWGRLGKAYKESIMMNRGYRWDPGAIQVYELSRQAYEKCVALLPNDADWHFGYGELLWWNTVYSQFGNHIDQRNDLVEAARQFKIALDIQPNHQRTLEILEIFESGTSMGSNTTPLIDLSKPKPDFIILTTTPTVRSEPTQESSATSLPSPTLTLSATPTPLPSMTITVTKAISATPGVTKVIMETPASNNREINICGVGLFPALGIIMIAMSRKNKKI